LEGLIFIIRRKSKLIFYAFLLNDQIIKKVIFFNHFIIFLAWFGWLLTPKSTG